MKWIPILILGLSLTGCCCCAGGSGGVVKDPNSGNLQIVNSANEKTLELVKFYDVADKNGLGVNIEGEVKNISKYPVSSVYIAFTLKDKNGKVLGMTNDLLGATLNPGETWSFKCNIYQDNVASYELSDLH